MRGLLQIFDYYEIRILNGIFQGLLISVTAALIWKQKGVKYALALATSYWLLMPSALSQCLQYTWVYYVAFGALLVYLVKRKYWEKDNRYIFFFVVVGAVTNYLDLLTYPLLTWGLLAVWWLLMQDKEETAISYLKK